MPTAPPRRCSRGCGDPAWRNGLCRRHYGQNDRRRGSRYERGYDIDHEQLFRREVLERCDYRCQADEGCPEFATVADHYPRTRKQLVRDGDDPNDPRYGRGLCKRHHDKHTASTSIAHQNTGR